MKIVTSISLLPFLFLLGCGTEPPKASPPTSIEPMCNSLAVYPEAFAMELADQVAGLPAGSPVGRAMNDYLLLRDAAVVLCTVKLPVTAEPAKPE
jgi:hypothetical protein